MINVYQTKSKSKIEGLETKPTVFKPNRPKPNSAPANQDLELQDENTFVSSINKLKLTKNKYRFQLFCVTDFLQNIILIFAIILLTRYFGALVLGFLFSGGNLFWSFYGGFLPIANFATLDDNTFAVINVYSILLTALVPTFVLVYWTIRKRSLTTTKNLYITIQKTINNLAIDSNEYRSCIKIVKYYLPKFFGEELLPWYISGYIGILQYLFLGLFLKDRQSFVFLQDVAILLILLQLVNSILILILNKSQKTQLAELKVFNNS